ncbi:aldo/keto reductase [Paraburkholderia dinghuensis]|uniref:Aldo/keto reductase n=1 Tax=Paraburkholderia dinghuensis TaxID=2305225 RepID=A0A3N6MVT3_9BURK|nr:aldo/keto reductase [Paraburkholderia dinghuensis]RQH02091.1 aldo/keto reductase [Paraburkholderia dinghuensis]
MKQSPSPDRRRFLKTGGVLAAGFLSHEVHAAPDQLPALPDNPKTQGSMPTRNLGKTGFKVGISSLGGQSAIEQPNNFDVAVPLIERALDLGVNFIDTAPRYGFPERWSEQYIGRVMEHRRNEVFLCTKTRERSRDGALRDIEQSLKLMKTDHLDLWLLHNIGVPEEINVVFGKGGAMEALTQMHDQKVVRHLGFAAHYQPDPIIELINRFPFDACILALNAADTLSPHSFIKRLLSAVVEKQMGIIGMKIAARGRILSSWTPPPVEVQRRSWEGVATRPGTLNMRDATNYVLSLPVSTVIVGCDNIAQLEENVRIAREFTPLSAAQMAAITQRAAPVLSQATFFHSETRPRDITLPDAPDE